MAAFTSYCTSADSNNYCYDVFINHRGPDVKKTFASHLYRRLISHGVRVFLDYQELQEGEHLSCQIEGAIRSASVHVAILSPTYAESQWCLNELVLMLESRAPIIPVFHHVMPSEVRWTRGQGVYALALQKLENKRTDDFQPRHNSTTIENWRSSLSRVADISGLDLKAFDGDEGELVDKVVEAVLKKVKKTQLNVARYPTGLDEKVEVFEKTVLLQQQSGRVHIVGITGLGGVGKTTLAKELFNRKSSNYSKSYFLFDVRENAKISLLSLQRKVIKGLTQSDPQIDSIDEGIEMLKECLSGLSSEVLLVLDDVDHVDQLYALLPLTGEDILPPDSLILITSRDKNVLARVGVQESSIHKLTGLNRERSRELFCSHAFGQPHPQSGFEYLVDKFLRACHGLPLSLKVFGGLLYGNNEISYWEDELERLEQILPDEIHKRLRISYDALQRDEQQIFLDIACFFIGENRDTAIRIWDRSGWQGSRGFQSLLNKCLVEVEVEVGMDSFQKKIRMHDQLRDLGRDLAKDSKLPRLIWRGRGNIDDFLQDASVVTNVRGIKMLRSEYTDEDNDHPSFSSYEMRKLQLLHIDIEADLRLFHLPDLIWLRWDLPCSSLPSWDPMKKLRVLQVSGLKLETLWQDELQAPLQLQELQIDAPISNIPKSIGQLKHLERILATGGTLKELPEEFCHLPSLTHLKLRYFSRLKSLPDSFGNLTNLEQIDMCGCSNLERLPNSFGKLIKLKYLDLSHCPHLTLEKGDFGNVSTLEHIDLTGCHKIEVLPSQIAHQRSLKKLDLDLPNLREWPSALGEPSGLEKLVLKAPSLEKLPSTVGRDLRNLKYLELRGCRSLKYLELRELVDSRCYELEDVPGAGNLKSLERLRACWCLKLKSIRCSAQLTNLRELDISHCYELEEMGIENLKSLEKLRARWCVMLKSIQGLAQLTQLLELDVIGCSELEELPGLEHLRSLEELSVYECVKLKRIQGLAQLTQLRELEVSGCSELEELPGLEHLRSLEKLWASGWVKLKSIQGLAQLTQLRELDVSGCSELEELPGLEHLRSLEELWATECVKLKSIQGLSQLTQLRELDVSGCSELEELPGCEHLRSLEKLWATKCVKLKSIQGLAQLTQLRGLYLSGCWEL